MPSRTILWLRGMLLLGFSSLIFYLHRTDQLALYIAPRMMVMVKLSCIGLYFLGMIYIIQWFRTRQGTHTASCGCDIHHKPRSLQRNVLTYALFLSPLILGFTLPQDTMGSRLVEKKGMNYQAYAANKQIESPSQTPPVKLQETKSASSARGESSSADNQKTETTPTSEASTSDREPSLDELFPEEPYMEAYVDYAKQLYQQTVIEVQPETYLETLTVMSMYQEAFVGKQIVLSGFIFKEDTFEDHQMAVARFAVQCCSADSSPFGMLVEWDGAAKWQEDTWVKVTGTLDQTTREGIDILLLRASSIERIDAPDDPYVYINNELGF